MNIINKPLLKTQIGEILDIHSPTAAGYHFDRGVDISKILKEHLKNFKIEFLDIYHLLGKATNKNRFTLLYDSILRKLFKKKGAVFFIVFKKLRER